MIVEEDIINGVIVRNFTHENVTEEDRQQFLHNIYNLVKDMKLKHKTQYIEINKGK